MYERDDLKKRAEKILPEVIDYRRKFHMNPELGFEEYETAAQVATYLERLGIEVETEVGGTGVVGVLSGEKPGKTIALRADMDALPIAEETGAEYASQVDGKMHACGHDAHTANLMGTARLLSDLTNCGKNLQGNVKFLFQPAEESPGGAEPMIEDGALKNPDVDAVLGMHVNTDLDSGKITMREDVVTASTDSAEIQIIGSGGHGAHPHKAVDSVVVAGQTITALQTLASREVNPTDSVVFTIGKIEGGFRNNVIAPSVTMEATIRSLNPDVRQSLPERIERIVRGVTEAMNAGYNLDYSFGYPSIINDKHMTALVQKVSIDLLGEDSVLHSEKPSMGGEDFAYFANEVPGCFFRVGVRNEEKGIGLYPGHHPNFDIDEEALKPAMMIMAETALKYLLD